MLETRAWKFAFYSGKLNFSKKNSIKRLENLYSFISFCKPKLSQSRRLLSLRLALCSLKGNDMRWLLSWPAALSRTFLRAFPSSLQLQILHNSCSSTEGTSISLSCRISHCWRLLSGEQQILSRVRASNSVQHHATGSYKELLLQKLNLEEVINAHPRFAASMTILPSPLPISKNFTELSALLGRTFIIFLSWLSVAGMNGSVNFLKAGETKGKHTTEIPIATAADVPIKIFPT